MNTREPTISLDVPSRPLLIAAFLIVYVIWGSTYLGIRLAIESIPPLFMAGTRYLVAGGAMFLFAFWRKTHRGPSGAPRCRRRMSSTRRKWRADLPSNTFHPEPQRSWSRPSLFSSRHCLIADSSRRAAQFYLRCFLKWPLYSSWHVANRIFLRQRLSIVGILA